MSSTSRIIITGGSRGIGYSIAKKFYDEGHNLVLISSSDKIHEVFKENDRVLKYKADVTSYDALNKLFKDLAKLSDIDCLINSAGISINGPLSIQSESAIFKVLNINLMGTIYTNKLTSKMFLKNKKQGSIINISSVIGLIGNPGQSVYSASKSGVIGLTKSLAKELGPRNIRVNCIAPGFINSDMTKDLNQELKADYLKRIPLSRFGEPEEIAEVTYLLYKSKYINGTVLTVDGGLSC